MTGKAPLLAPCVKLSSGQNFPVLGLGTWQSQKGEVGEAVKAAIDLGYRHIDCAMLYQNEKEIGEAIAEKIEGGVVKREDLFITSKLWLTYHRPALVESACRKTLEDLGVSYVDLYLMHWPVSFKPGVENFPKQANGLFDCDDVDIVDTYKAMENCVDLGLAKSIGVSNFNSEQLQRILDVAKHRPVNNQVECNAYLSQRKLIKFCQDRGVVLTSYGPLGGAPGASDLPEGSKVLLKDETVAAMAKKYNKTVAQILLRYVIQIGTVTIPKSVKKERLYENMNIFDFEISAKDMKILNGLDHNLRAYGFPRGAQDKDYPFNIEF